MEVSDSVQFTVHKQSPTERRTDRLVWISDKMIDKPCDYQIWYAIKWICSKFWFGTNNYAIFICIKTAPIQWLVYATIYVKHIRFIWLFLHCKHICWAPVATTATSTKFLEFDLLQVIFIELHLVHAWRKFHYTIPWFYSCIKYSLHSTHSTLI